MRALVFLAALLFTAPAIAAPQIVTDQGPLTGTTTNGVDAYKNIPYAAPPVGDLRWRPPQPGPHWTSPRDATAFGLTACTSCLAGKFSNGTRSACVGCPTGYYADSPSRKRN